MIKQFARFIITENYKLFEKNLMCSDVKVFRYTAIFRQGIH